MQILQYDTHSKHAMSDYISPEIKLFHCVSNACVRQTYTGFLQLVLIYYFLKSLKYIKLNKNKYKNLYRETYSRRVSGTSY